MVTVERDDESTGTNTVADAIRLVPHGTAINLKDIDVPLMHYFIWTDLNHNDITDVGEVYLVVLRCTTSSGDPQPEDFVREVYAVPESYQGEPDFDRCTDVDSVRGYQCKHPPTPSYEEVFPEQAAFENKMRVDYMIGPLAPEDIPPGLVAKMPDANGDLQIASPSQEAQNFGNWFAYYRRRMLMAKYALAASIIDLEFVNVGFYTVWESATADAGDRVGVLPIHVDGQEADQASLIVDNKDSGFSVRQGVWVEAGYADEQEYDQSSLISEKCSFFETCAKEDDSALGSAQCEEEVTTQKEYWEYCGYESAAECTANPGVGPCTEASECTYIVRKWMDWGYSSSYDCYLDGHSYGECYEYAEVTTTWWEAEGYASLEECQSESSEVYWQQQGYASYDDCVRSNCTSADELGAGATVRWTPNVPATDNYRIYVTYAADQAADKQACYTIKHYYGITDCIYLNQTVNGGKYQLLRDPAHPDGVFTLYAGSTNYVQLSRSKSPTITDNGYFVNADAVMFSPVSDTVDYDKTDDLLDAVYSDLRPSTGGTPLRGGGLWPLARYFDVGRQRGGFNPGRL